MRKSIMLAFCGLAFLAGCNNQGNKASNIPATPKWKVPYRLAFDTKAAKPGSAAVSLPPINFTANPDALETRVSLVVRFDASGVKKDTPLMDQVIIGPFDIHGADGTLPPDNMDQANKGLAKLLDAYCMNGKVKVTVALARSSLTPQAGDAE
ncbi:MAG: hypothetical protein WCA11_09890, partial [Terracidiphilus sp.]